MKFCAIGEQSNTTADKQSHKGVQARSVEGSFDHGVLLFFPIHYVCNGGIIAFNIV